DDPGDAMSIWRIFGFGKVSRNTARLEDASSNPSSGGVVSPQPGQAQPLSHGRMMATPNALGRMLQLGVVDPGCLTRQCCHREFRGEIWECPQPALVICGACGEGSCLDPFHAYSRFCTARGAVSFLEKSGSKF